MYCPNCKQEFPGKFCPECGAKLVELPKQNDLGINISDDAAIMGGVNVTRNESHNTTSYDHRVINTSNVTNIVERQKTEAELRNERNIQFMELCKEVFKDGLLDEEEKGMLVTERIRLGIDETEAARLIEMARKSSMSRMTTLGMRDSMTLKTIDRYIESNNVQVLCGQIPRLEALARNYKVDEVLYRYYMLLAALQPEKLILEYETNAADEYWKTYWVAIAYMKRGDAMNAEDAIVKLDFYPEYSEDNSLLLSAVSTYGEFGADAASEYICAILPEHCSSLLMPFIHALFLEVSPERAAEIGADKDKCQFYIDNLVNLESPEEKVARKELCLVSLNDKYGFADGNGNIVIPLKYDDAKDFSEGLASVKLNGKWGYIDKSGNEVIPLKYNEADNFSEGLAAVKLDGKRGILDRKCGFIDKNGNVVIPFKYDDAEDFSEGIAIVKLDGKCGILGPSKCGFIDKSGNEVTPLKYDLAGDFSEGLARVKLNGKYGYIDKGGNEVIPFKYDSAGDFSEGLALVELNGKYGFIDKSGKEVIPFKYDDALSFSDDLASVKLNDKYGFIDKSGKEVIQLKYDDAWSFSEGRARVELNDKWGFIDKSGKEVIPLKYDDAWNFSKGLALVKLNDKYGFIDKSGNEVTPLKYDGAEFFSDGLATVELNGKWGFIDKSGKEVIPLKYDDVYFFSDGLAKVELNGEEFYIDKKGNRIV